MKVLQIEVLPNCSTFNIYIRTYGKNLRGVLNFKLVLHVCIHIV